MCRRCFCWCCVCHTHTAGARCIRCGKEHSLEHVKAAVFSDEICHCTKCKYVCVGVGSGGRAVALPVLECRGAQASDTPTCGPVSSVCLCVSATPLLSVLTPSSQCVREA
jgi:hypothetical protein